MRLSRLAKFLGVVLAVTISLAAIANEFIRVSGVCDNPSQGIIQYWLKSKNMAHFSDSATCSLAAMNLFAKHFEEGFLLDEASEATADANRIRRYFEKALFESKQVEHSYLIRSHPLLKKPIP